MRLRLRAPIAKFVGGSEVSAIELPVVRRALKAIRRISVAPKLVHAQRWEEVWNNLSTSLEDLDRMRRGTASASKLTSSVPDTWRPPPRAKAPRWLATPDSAVVSIASTRPRTPGSVARAPSATSNWREVAYLDLVAEMLAVPKDEIVMARLVLNALRDPLGRTVLERLSRRPHDPLALVEMTGRNYDEIKYQVRKLIAIGAISKMKHFYYVANPHASHAVRSYVDVLLTLASYTNSRPEYYVY